MIKNNTVIIEAEGEDDKLTLFGDWVTQGPDGSMVDSMISCEKEVIGYEDFNIL
jgi:acylphosphatase